MAVDTRFVVEQFALCQRFASMGQTKSSNSLLPESYARVQTNYLKQNRKESFGAAYADVNRSYTFPESLELREGRSPPEQQRELQDHPGAVDHRQILPAV